MSRRLAADHAPNAEELPQTLYESYRLAARRNPTAEMLVWSEAGLERISLPQAVQQGAALAEGLRRLGIARGDVVAMQLPQSLELVRGLARHKTPERLEFLAALPRNATGKVLKHELRRRLKGGSQVL